MILKLLLVVLLGFASGCVTSGDQRAQEIKNQVKESIYRLEANGHGTGFIVENANGKNLMVTNAHVCNGAPMGLMNAVASNGKETLVRILHKSDKTDLCILQAPKGAIPLDIADRAFRDELVYSVGYPLGPFMTVQAGRLKGYEWTQSQVSTPLPLCIEPKHSIETKKVPIRQVDGSTLYVYDRVCTVKVYGYFTTIPTDRGFSGSPMLNDDGEVVGVIMAMQGNVSWGLAVDIKALKRYLKYKTK